MALMHAHSTAHTTPNLTNADCSGEQTSRSSATPTRETTSESVDGGVSEFEVLSTIMRGASTTASPTVVASKVVVEKYHVAAALRSAALRRVRSFAACVYCGQPFKQAFDANHRMAAFLTMIKAPQGMRAPLCSLHRVKYCLHIEHSPRVVASLCHQRMASHSYATALSSGWHARSCILPAAQSPMTGVGRGFATEAGFCRGRRTVQQPAKRASGSTSARDRHTTGRSGDAQPSCLAEPPMAEYTLVQQQQQQLYPPVATRVRFSRGRPGAPTRLHEPSHALSLCYTLRTCLTVVRRVGGSKTHRCKRTRECPCLYLPART